MSGTSRTKYNIGDLLELRNREDMGVLLVIDIIYDESDVPYYNLYFCEDKDKVELSASYIDENAILI